MIMKYYVIFFGKVMLLFLVAHNNVDDGGMDSDITSDHSATLFTA